LSIVVPDALIKDFVHKDKEANKWKYNDEESIKMVKKKIADKYSVDASTILTIDELANTPNGKDKQYNVIVLPGESDLSASRKDVNGTYLILH
jgi:hypothetical protein